jgi:hypothetical protein
MPTIFFGSSVTDDDVILFDKLALILMVGGRDLYCTGQNLYAKISSISSRRDFFALLGLFSFRSSEAVVREFEGGLMRFWFFTTATRREGGLRAKGGGA